MARAGGSPGGGSTPWVLGAAAAAVLLLGAYLFSGGGKSDEDKCEADAGKGGEVAAKAGDVVAGADGGKASAKAPPPTTKEEVIAMLEAVAASQAQMKSLMRTLTQRLSSLPDDAPEARFEKVYATVLADQPQDPLEAHNMAMGEFDVLVDKYQDEPAVRDLIEQIMGAPSTALRSMSAAATSMRPADIVNVHRFMLGELKTFVDAFRRRPDIAAYDLRVVTLAIQAIVGARTQRRFGYSAEDIEASVFLHHQSLLSNREFTQINMEMQQLMTELLGVQMAGQGFF